MKFKGNQIRLAVALALAGGAMAANAALVAPGNATFTPAQVASEMPTTGIVLTANASQLYAGSAITNFAPSTGQNLTVAVTLNNGATFKTNPVLTCSAANNAATVDGTLNLGGANTAQATFTITYNNVSAQVSADSALTYCYVSAPDLNVTGAHSDVAMSITYTYGTLASSSVNGTLVQFQTGLTASKTAADDVVALVTGGFVQVSGGVSATLVSAGLVKWGKDGTAASTATNLATPVELGDVLGVGSGTITVAGNALAAARTTAGVWLVTAAGTDCNTTTGLAAAAYATAAGGSTSVTFTGVSAEVLSAGLFVCFKLNGTSAVPEGSITATIGGTAKSGYSLPTNSAMTLNSVSRNGSSTRALNITAPSNSDATYVRIYNTSSIAGKVYGTLYAQDGTVIGTANSVLATATEFPSGGVVVKSAQDVMTAVGATTEWTGRAQLAITAETPSMRAQNLIRSGGILVNVGGDTSSNNN